MTDQEIDHLQHFSDFVRGVDTAGGTTPHVAMTVEAMRPLEDRLEKLWWAGCYALTYNWPAAERLWQEWRPEAVNELDFLLWLEEHRPGIPLRKERKAIFRLPFFADSATSYAAFATRLAHANYWPEDYEDAYRLFTGSCRYMGRYIAIRWLEVMRRAFPEECGAWRMPDIRASGGEHPIKAMQLIYPEQLPMPAKEVPTALADQMADTLLVEMEMEHGLTSDYYEIQSLLCEYKQEWFARKQYPGKSIDTEMDYFRRVYDYWGAEAEAESIFYDVRQACFPAWSLGEVDDKWWGVRKELGTTLREYGYVWSDARYDYQKTTDLAEPVRRAA